MHTDIIAYGIIIAALIAGYIFVKLPIVRRAYLPASVIAGLLLLAFSPQLTNIVPAPFYQSWAPLPALLINVVFAALFLGRPFISLRKMWQLASPQAAFGQMIAWGYYAVGGLVTLAILIPLFAATPLSAALIEMSFEGGHGTAAGMIPVFKELNFPEGQEITVALATTSLVCTLVSGFLLIGWGRRRGHVIHQGPIESIHDRIYLRGVLHDLKAKGVEIRAELTPWRFVTHGILLAVSVGFGWLIHFLLLQLEHATWSHQGIEIFDHMPVFTFCMFGGMIAQFIWSSFGWHVSRVVVEMLSSAALSVLITTAIGTMSLDFFAKDGWIFAILAATGVAWVLFCFLLLARFMFKRHWFTNGIVSVGQSMGTTATGLLFAQMVDPKRKTGAVESFGYKQLLFEPFMGGGIVTALSMPLILAWGLPVFTAVCAGISVMWMVAGVLYFSRRS
jgi:glutamate:Na+ symporter, ESS family